MKYSTILLLFCSVFAVAQPATGNLFKCNAYVCDLDALDMPDGHLSFKNFKFINGDNRAGYNCNPAWSGEGNKNILFLGVSNAQCY